MAAEYDVREIGYIGSIWLGETTPPKIVGRTIQVVNIPNTIEQGGWDPDGPPSGQTPPVAVYFTNKDDIDLNTFNKQLPSFFDGNKNSYNIKRLSQREINQIATTTKVAADYLSGLTVVYYQNTRGEDTLIPIQNANDWGSFRVEKDDNGNTVATYYLGSSDIQYVTKYVFLVSFEELDLLKSYFQTVQSQETIFDPPVNANPLEYINQRKPQRATGVPPIIDFSGFKPPIGDPRPFNERIIEILKRVPFPKPSYYNDIHEDVLPMVAETDAATEFVKLISNSPEQFYISQAEGDEEYKRLSESIKNAIKSLHETYMGGPDTPIPIENRITIAEDGGIILGDTL